MQWDVARLKKNGSYQMHQLSYQSSWLSQMHWMPVTDSNVNCTITQIRISLSFFRMTTVTVCHTRGKYELGFFAFSQNKKRDARQWHDAIMQNGVLLLTQHATTVLSVPHAACAWLVWLLAIGPYVLGPISPFPLLLHDNFGFVAGSSHFVRELAFI